MLLICWSPTASFYVFNWWATLNKMKWIISWTFPVNIAPIHGNKLNVTFIHQIPWIAIRWISTFIRVMACYKEVASHYLNTSIVLDLWRHKASLNRNILYKNLKTGGRHDANVPSLVAPYVGITTSSDATIKLASWQLMTAPAFQWGGDEVFSSRVTFKT